MTSNASTTCFPQLEQALPEALFERASGINQGQGVGVDREREGGRERNEEGKRKRREEGKGRREEKRKIGRKRVFA